MKETRSFLFIGGPADGERKTLPVSDLRHTIYVLPALNFNADDGPAKPSDRSCFKLHYRQEKFAFGGSNKSILFMVYEPMKLEEAVSRLFVHYNP